jgi:hypothetical protein
MSRPGLALFRPTSGIGPGQYTGHEIISNVVKGFHQKNNGPIGDRLEESRAWLDETIQRPAKDVRTSLGDGLSSVECRVSLL